MNIDEDQIIAMPMGMSTGVPQQQRSDRADFIDKIKPEIVAENLRQKLLGKHFINGEWKELESLKEWKLTEVGAESISNLLLGVSTISTTISIYKEHMIRNRLRNLAKAYAIISVTNREAYGFRNHSHILLIYQIFFSSALAVLQQAENGSIQELLKGTVHEQRNVNQDIKPPSRLRRILGMG